MHVQSCHNTSNKYWPAQRERGNGMIYQPPTVHEALNEWNETCRNGVAFGSWFNMTHLLVTGGLSDKQLSNERNTTKAVNLIMERYVEV